MQDPLVFLPGIMCDARLFTGQTTRFSATHSVTVAPITGGDRVEEIASRLLDVLPRRCAMVGLSMGGVVAMELLRRAPERISRLALISTNALAETPQTAADYEPVIIKLKSGRLDEALQALLPPDCLAPGPLRARVLTHVHKMATHLGPEAVIRQVRALQRRRDYQAVLRRSSVPVQVLCGGHDRLTPPKRHELMAELVPNARLTVLQEAGHLPVLEAPDATNRVLSEWMAMDAATA